MFISVETNFSLWNLLVNFNRHLQKQKYSKLQPIKLQWK